MGKASNPWVNLLIKRGTVTTKPVQVSLRGSGKKGPVQQLNSQLRKSIVFLMTFLLINSELVATNRQCITYRNSHLVLLKLMGGLNGAVRRGFNFSPVKRMSHIKFMSR